MKMRSQFLGLGFLCAASFPAFAADPVEEALHDWSGLYIGLSGGYDFGKTEHGVVGAGLDWSEPFDNEGFLGGATLGWNHQSGNLVFGLESDLSYADIDGELTDCVPSCITEINWLGTVRARAGYSLDSVLIFATGGLAVGGAEASSFVPGSGGEDTVVGWTVGAGAEMAISESLSMKAEYLYVDLGDFSYGLTDARISNNSVVRVGLNFHF